MAIKVVSKTLRPLNDVGTYVCMTPHQSGINDLGDIADYLGVSGHPRYATSEFHVTLMYSRGYKPSDIRTSNMDYEARMVGCEYWPGHDGDGYVVVKLESKPLEQRHRDWVMRGLVHSFEDYSPHTTLVDKLPLTPELEQRIQKVNLLLQKQRPKIVFGSETIEGIKP